MAEKVIERFQDLVDTEKRRWQNDAAERFRKASRGLLTSEERAAIMSECFYPTSADAVRVRDWRDRERDQGGEGRPRVHQYELF